MCEVVSMIRKVVSLYATNSVLDLVAQRLVGFFFAWLEWDQKSHWVNFAVIALIMNAEQSKIDL
jgi:hypothetical protein